MYVVKKSFRNYGQIIVPGSIVEPGTIKRFKSLLGEKRIIEVNEHNFKTWQEYFKVKFNIELPNNNSNIDSVEDSVEDNTEVKNTVKATVVAKASAKVTIK